MNFTFPIVQPPGLTRIRGIADIIRATFHRPANTTQYTAGDVVFGRMFLCAGFDSIYLASRKISWLGENSPSQLNYTVDVGTTNTLLDTWITDENTPGVNLLNGDINVSVVAGVSDAAAGVTLFADICVVAADGTVTVLGSTNASAALNAGPTTYTLTYTASAVALEPDDRLMIRLYATPSSTGQVAVILGVGDQYDSRFWYPSAIVFPHSAPFREGSGVIQSVHLAQSPEDAPYYPEDDWPYELPRD